MTSDKAKLLQGKALAERLLKEIRSRAEAVSEQRGEAPHLAVVSIGGDPASEIFLKNKLQACKDAGLDATVEALPERAAEADVLRLLTELEKNPSVDGIILELPLPKHLNSVRLIDAIAPDKDVEGVGALNSGRFYRVKSYAELEGSSVLIPCTAHAIVRLLLEAKQETAGKDALVIGRSEIVGKPTAHLLSTLDATVTLAHSRTKDLEACVRRADILVAAAGKPGLVKGDWVKPGAVVLDAGVHRSGKNVVGDVEFEKAVRNASRITPVPGGIGPLTVAFLLHNTVLSAEKRAGA